MIVKVFAIALFVFQQFCASVKVCFYRIREVVNIGHCLICAVNDESFENKVMVSKNGLAAEFQAVVVGFVIGFFEFSLTYG